MSRFRVFFDVRARNVIARACNLQWHFCGVFKLCNVVVFNKLIYLAKRRVGPDLCDFFSPQLLSIYKYLMVRSVKINEGSFDNIW